MNRNISSLPGPSQAVSSASDGFGGFQDGVSPARDKMEVLNAPLLVRDYESLPNEKFQLVSNLLSRVHPDRKRFVKVVFNKIGESFELVPLSKQVANLSYEDYSQLGETKNRGFWGKKKHASSTPDVIIFDLYGISTQR